MYIKKIEDSKKKVAHVICNCTTNEMLTYLRPISG